MLARSHSSNPPHTNIVAVSLVSPWHRGPPGREPDRLPVQLDDSVLQDSYPRLSKCLLFGFKKRISMLLEGTSRRVSISSGLSFKHQTSSNLPYSHLHARLQHHHKPMTTSDQPWTGVDANREIHACAPGTAWKDWANIQRRHSVWWICMDLQWFGWLHAYCIKLMPMHGQLTQNWLTCCHLQWVWTYPVDF